MKSSLALISIVGFAGGILLGTLYPLPLSCSLFVLLLSVGFFCAWFFGRRDAYLIPCVLLLVLSLGCARASIVPRTLPAAFSHDLGQPTSFNGTIIADPDVRENNQRVTVEISKGTVRTKIIAVADRFPALTYGDTVRVTGVLGLPQPFDTEGGRTFAYDTFLAKDGIFALVPLARVEVTGRRTDIETKTLGALFGAKHAFASALENALPEPSASLAEGLIIGGKQGLGKKLLDAFTVAGLLPIIVLSGYNVMIVAESVLAGLSWLPKRFALGIAAVSVLLFVVAAGSGSSAVRAGLMAGLALFARSTGRTYDALRALIVVFVAMLLLSPFSLAYDPGFQFSFMATLGLLLASNAFELRLMFIRWAFMRDIIATTLAAQLFVLPILLYQTGNFSLVAVPANILVLPFVPLAMGLSTVGGFIALLIPFLATYVGLPAYAVLSYIIFAAESFAQLPLANVIVPAFPFVFLVIPYAGIAWFVWHIRKTAPAGAASPKHSASFK